MDRHPRLPAKTPPRRGPIVGPKHDSVLKMPRYLPLSCGRATSEMTPAPMAIVALAPELCTMRMTRRSQYAFVGQSACPTLDSVKIRIVPMKMGLVVSSFIRLHNSPAAVDVRRRAPERGREALEHPAPSA